jgi:hypothetical protein
LTINEGYQSKRRKDDDLKEIQAQADLRHVLALPEGRRVMYRVLEMCGCGVIDSDPQRIHYSGEYGTGAADTHHTYAAIGEVTLGNRLKLDILTLVPDLFTKMMMEAATRAAEEILSERTQKEKTHEVDES